MHKFSSRLALLICFVGAQAALWAQTTLYPVRVDHKWGFIIRKPRAPYHKMRVEPLYELLGDVPLVWNTLSGPAPVSPYRLCEIDGRAGLLDDTYNVVLEPRYKRIRPLTARYFAVETDSLFTVVTPDGTEVMPGRWSDIVALTPAPDGETAYFAVRRDQRWGVVHRSDGLLFEPRYADVALADTSGRYFRVREQPGSDEWGLADRRGVLVVPVRYADILVLAPGFFAVKTIELLNTRVEGKKIEQRIYWQLWENGKPLPAQYRSVERLTPKWLALSSASAPTEFRNMSTRATVQCPETYSRFWRLDDRYIGAYSNTSYGVGLLDTLLRPVLTTTFDSITPSGVPGVYRVLKQRFWGLLAPGRRDSLAVPCVYRSVARLQQGVFIVRTGDRYGALDAQLAFLATPKYREIECWGDTVLALRAPDDKLFTLDRRTRTLTEYGETSILAGRSWRLSNDVLRDTVVAEDGDADQLAQLHFAEPDSLARLRIEASGPVHAVEALAPAGPLVAYRTDRRATWPAVLGGYAVMGMALHAPGGAAVPGFGTMLGCRPFAENNPYTAFIDARGRMGLIDRAGRPAQDRQGRPVEFTYIGPFHLGRARVCVGGELRVSRVGEVPPVSIYTAADLLGGFRLKWAGEPDPAVRLKYVYVAPTGDSKPRWGFIDVRGNVVVEPAFDQVSTFQRFDSAAVVARYNNRNRLDYGLLHHRGHFLIDVRYSAVSRRAHGYRVEVDSTPIFYFNGKGHQILTNAYRPAGFSEGFCPVRNAGQRYGVIDTAGNLVVPFVYDQIREFREGLAAAFDGSRWSFIDGAGRTVFVAAATDKPGNTLGNFSNGRCAFFEKTASGAGVWGYYDRRGQAVIAPRFRIAATQRAAPPFVAGAAALLAPDSATRQWHWAIIDTAGALLMKPNPAFDYIDTFEVSGTARARYKTNRRYVVIDRHGQPISPPFDHVERFYQGFARVRNGSTWGLIDTRGRIRLPVKYAAVDSVSEGLVAVQASQGGTWVYLDTDGRPSTVKGQFMSAGRFQGGSAMVNGGKDAINRRGERLRVEGQSPFLFREHIFGLPLPRGGGYFFADGDGTNYFKRDFKVIRPFNHGVAQVKVDEKPTWGAINRRGLFIIAPKYRNIHQQADGNFVINSQRFIGVLDCDGREVLAPQYDRIQNLPDGVARVECGEAIGYFDLGKRRWIWPLGR